MGHTSISLDSGQWNPRHRSITEALQKDEGTNCLHWSLGKGFKFFGWVQRPLQAIVWKSRPKMQVFVHTLIARNLLARHKLDGFWNFNKSTHLKIHNDLGSGVRSMVILFSDETIPWRRDGNDSLAQGSPNLEVGLRESSPDKLHLAVPLVSILLINCHLCSASPAPRNLRPDSPTIFWCILANTRMSTQ